MKRPSASRRIAHTVESRRSDSLGRRTFDGVAWMFAQNGIGERAACLVLEILLSPSDYGMISLAYPVNECRLDAHSRARGGESGGLVAPGADRHAAPAKAPELVFRG